MISVGSNEDKYLFSMALCVHFASMKIICHLKMSSRKHIHSYLLTYQADESW